MKKFISLFSLGLTAMILTACGGQEASKPVDVVTAFLESVQAGDLEKASTYISKENTSEEFDFTGLKEGNEDPATAALVQGISNNYQFKTPTETAIDENNAEVTVEITSLDFAAAMGTAMQEILGVAFELAAKDQTEEEYNKAMDEKSTEILSNAMTSKDAEMITRDVTLTLTKNNEGQFKIVSNEQLMEAVLGNAKEVEEMFSGM
ncbi:DUF4878 domain-containing protein [Ureibacillus manganicus]|uniref:DUF4878 domain-containing protein n=1 Tax=Ureibacillus manganicus DSM 26584 TaxID=1384049 RepID=A0A0A3I2N7_9BACL|nr:DUF4878 domain-containing protein [Ureibacillus manganicus]KGR77755.1 hypothetical protein CD29_13985 [Ureibacillus manganicus DSM 26584]